MSLIPEPTLFAAPPAWADDAQRAALFSHFAGIALCGAAALVAFARSPKKGLVSHALIGVGLALAGGAAFTGMSLYNNFIYKEVARHAAETPLFLMSGAALLVALGTGLIPGFVHKRGAWLKVVVPVLALAGFALAGVSQLPSVVADTGKILGALGGLLVAGAGGLHIFDKTASAKNPQERAGASVGFALIVSGVLVAVGAPMSRGDGVDKGTLAIAMGEAAFGLFAIMALMTVEGSASDYQSAPRPTRTDFIPPPPGGVDIPPPPGVIPPAPGSRPVAPGVSRGPVSTPPAPGRAPGTAPARPASTPPPRKPGA